MWDGVLERLGGERYLPLALDLPGHGACAPHARATTFESCVAHVLARAPGRFVLCGYSLGGRIALHVALAAPGRVSRLVLIACDPGIEDQRERAARRAADETLAHELEHGTLAAFAERWNAQSLFAHDPIEVRTLARADQLRNDPHALAAALRALGTGSMQPLWDRVRELAIPVTFVAGERDVKFTAIGRRFAALAPDCMLIALPGGHRLPLEDPAGVAHAIAAAHADDVPAPSRSAGV
jgi:2-succinyl-6-hydroxy-2,4-cyclohexadiene-1-carboxylate synthase